MDTCKIINVSNLCYSTVRANYSHNRHSVRSTILPLIVETSLFEGRQLCAYMTVATFLIITTINDFSVRRTLRLFNVIQLVVFVQRLVFQKWKNTKLNTICRKRNTLPSSDETKGKLLLISNCFVIFEGFFLCSWSTRCCRKPRRD